MPRPKSSAKKEASPPPGVAAQLHPRLNNWIAASFGQLTQAQELTLPHILAGRSVLLSSPTGSGKTLAGFLGILDHLVRQHEAGTLGSGICAIYISPLRALTYDIQKNLMAPLEGMGLTDIIRIGLRTGDTSATDRAKLKRKPPHILLTTPESLAILLPQAGWAEALSQVRFVIVDELHALAENKRGAHLTLSLERLARRTSILPVRIGLSATAAPLPLLAQMLVGTGRNCEIVEARMERRRRVEVLSPLRKNPYPPTGFTAQRVMQDIAQIVERNRSVIIFCNMRSSTESVTYRLKNGLPKLADKIEAHHASLDRDVRLEVEDRLKNGDLRAVVCSTSLEMGIDIGSVDCVVMISTPKGISRALQRIGRSGHSIHAESHGILVATNVNDLMECIVCAEMTRAVQLDEVRLLEKPLDVLAQHLVGLAMEGGCTRDAALETVRAASPFRHVSEEELDRVLNYLEAGGRSLEKQYRENFGKIVWVDGFMTVPSKKVEREYLANIGVIHTEGMVSVFLGKRRLGQVEESFMKRLKTGDLFVLAGRTVRLVETGVAEARVEDATGRLPTVPAWNANKMPLTSGLAREVARFRTELAARVAKETGEEVCDWLVERYEISTSNAQSILQHAFNQLRVSLIPTQHTLLIERFVDDREGSEPDLVQFFFHTLIGRSANDALSRIIAYRVKKAVGGNAMVTIDDYGFLLTLKTFQDLGLEEWKVLFENADPEADMRAALQDSELVKWNFRGVAQTGLMVPRNRPGQDRRIKQLRWSTEILFRVLSEHEPDHPMLVQSYREATHTFLDLPRAMDFLQTALSLDWYLVEVPVVSPFSFGLFASKIKEGMMLEDPEEAIERLWREYEKKVGGSADGSLR
ncbi:ATP-dependent Lhr-like helicase [Prosthecobacter fusiformis]|uniref:ATP-dependent Lhr-like helicase n=1 Tax=Prosthecobacter fusiformis TaxID=48464 RepID=A0A4R7RLE2_9BACT|nr:DEAD/DEAH box helicase [Prosthecobacter fusiformis]TDU66092.1 ATP-dependent Lhr-like helicase [Prosthecobacter fusiformis]